MCLTNYLWFQSYQNAICETDETKKAGLLLEARSALEQRLLSPVRSNSEEEVAINNALETLAMLTVERNARVNRRVDDLIRESGASELP
jgi:hypothetical protein